MSDTKALIKYVRDRLNDGPNITFGKPTVLDLVDALEQAEDRAEKAEKELAGADAEISELRDELEDSRGTEKDTPNVLCAIARLVGVYEHSQELGDDMGTLVFEAVSDLLAEKQKYAPRALRWTHEPPKVAGWYWRKETVADRAHVFHFAGNWEDYGEHWESDRVCQLPLNLNGNLWAGPIAPPIEP